MHIGKGGEVCEGTGHVRTLACAYISEGGERGKGARPCEHLCEVGSASCAHAGEGDICKGGAAAGEGRHLGSLPCAHVF